MSHRPTWEQHGDVASARHGKCICMSAMLRTRGFSEQGGTPDDARPTTALNSNDCIGCNARLAYRLTPRATKRQTPKTHEALSVVDKDRRWQCHEGKRHGTTPALVLKEDEPSIGNGHRSSARSKIAKSHGVSPRNLGETLKCDPPPGLDHL